MLIYLFIRKKTEKKMDEKKFVGRVENMLKHICGCSPEESIIILNKCKAKIKKESKISHEKLKQIKKRNKKIVQSEIAFKEFWTNYVKTKPCKEWKKLQKEFLDYQMKKYQECYK